MVGVALGGELRKLVSEATTESLSTGGKDMRTHSHASQVRSQAGTHRQEQRKGCAMEAEMRSAGTMEPSGESLGVQVKPDVGAGFKAGRNDLHN